MRDKHFLRRWVEGAVLALPAARRARESRRIARRLAALSAFRRARTVGLYLALSVEPDTAPILALCRRLKKDAALPVVFPGRRALRFALYRPGDPLRKNVHGIPEPARPRWVRPADLDLLLVPGRAYSPDGHRLGAGGGYYDRFLARRPRPTAIGLAFSPQLLRRLPCGPRDRPVDAVMTAEGLHARADAFLEI